MHKNYIFYIGFLLGSLQLAGCNNATQDEAEYIIQCINNPAANTKSREFDAVIHDGKRHCHALLWRIPKIYSPDKITYPSDRYESITDSLSIKLPEIATSDKSQIHLTNREIQFQNNWEYEGKKRIVGHFVSEESIYELKRNSTRLYGLDVYASDELARSHDMKLAVFSHLIHQSIGSVVITKTHLKLSPQTACAK